MYRAPPLDTTNKNRLSIYSLVRNGILSRKGRKKSWVADPTEFGAGLRNGPGLFLVLLAWGIGVLNVGVGRRRRKGFFGLFVARQKGRRGLLVPPPTLSLTEVIGNTIYCTVMSSWSWFLLLLWCITFNRSLKKKSYGGKPDALGFLRSSDVIRKECNNAKWTSDMQLGNAHHIGIGHK